MANIKRIIKVGDRFRKLIVVEKAEPKPYSNPRRKRCNIARWKCECDCGNKIIVLDNHLKTGNTKSCGCLKVESSTKTINNHNERMFENNPVHTAKLSSYQRQVLDGELLGDGSITKGKKHSGFTLSVSMKNKDDIKFVNKIFSNFDPRMYVRRTKGSFFCNHHAKSILLVRITTKANIYLTKQRKRWYPYGKMIVPNDLVLTPTVCFHWYKGDGSFARRSFCIALATHNFTLRENELLKYKLSTVGLEAKVQLVCDRRTDKTYYYLRFNRNDTKKFFDYIRSEIIAHKDELKCYTHKWKEYLNEAYGQ